MAVHHRERNRGRCLVGRRVVVAVEGIRKRDGPGEQSEEGRTAVPVEGRTVVVVARRIVGEGRHRRRPCCPERDLVLLRVWKRDP